ncbi:unnamed protein product [Prorocentrum cordatum]|uniref:Protein RFT1 homolog n=1 Tax=Prorocentrum cordatum TaxID=2364126 RepID=A0ABN9VQH6_9DINO|nr:unnamed protein product [Polarella glacialis]
MVVFGHLLEKAVCHVLSLGLEGASYILCKAVLGCLTLLVAPQTVINEVVFEIMLEEVFYRILSMGLVGASLVQWRLSLCEAVLESLILMFASLDVHCRLQVMLEGGFKPPSRDGPTLGCTPCPWPGLPLCLQCHDESTSLWILAACSDTALFNCNQIADPASSRTFWSALSRQRR